MTGPLAGADGDMGALTINIKKHRRRAPWEVLLENPGAPTNKMSTMIHQAPTGGLVPIQDPKDAL
jgi:hypothetical protein